MSSPFQQKFMAKNPVKRFTLDQLKKASDKSQKEMVKNAETLNKQNPEAGGQNYEKKEEFDFPGADGYETKEDSPLNAYVSTAPHFQRLQDNIARAFSQTGGGKTKKEKETEFKAETEKVAEKLKETTDKGFKDYSAKADFNSKSGSVFDKDENNYFNKYGQ